jgi:hypothetical protein
LIIKRVPTDYSKLKPRELFKLIEHSTITMRQDNKAKKFDPLKSGMVVLIEWNVDRAK